MIETKLLTISRDTPDPGIIAEASAVLKAGGLVAFPTETVYGLGADALNAKAVERVFEAKGRPADNPLIVHVADQSQLIDFVDEMPRIGTKLLNEFWPGALTIVTKRTFLVPDVVAAHLDTVAVRMPNHPVARALITAFGGGIVGPSANLSGRPSPTLARHVQHDLRGRIDMILDAGPTVIGVESTVIDVTMVPPMILRRGGVSVERIERLIGRVQTSEDTELLQRSPGTRHRHYAPSARVILVEEGDREGYTREVQTHRQSGKKVGAILHSPQLSNLERSEYVRPLPQSLDVIAQQLFGLLREMDELSVDVIVVEAVKEDGIGAAVMDRLRRASETS